MTDRFRNIKYTSPGIFEGEQMMDSTDTPMMYRFTASFPLFLIREAWDRGCPFEREADGFGPGAGTHGDWSAIRDSSDEAKAQMLCKALNYLFPLRKREEEIGRSGRPVNFEQAVIRALKRERGED